MIYVHKSRLSVSRQQRLLEHFVAGTTARAAAELVGVQPNTAIRFYQRPRQLIASKLLAKWRPTRAILAATGKTSTGVGRPEKSLYLAY
jgi:hypothetical protein